MASLLLRLAGPMQSWGAESKFETRRTMDFPTKSGVIGMLAAALGYTRDMPLDRLNSLKFGVRADYDGIADYDYHIARNPKQDKLTYITNREYIYDAVFLAGVESDDTEFLQELENALKNPVYQLYLGRRSCPPTMPLVLGIRDGDLQSCLKSEKWLLPEWRRGSKENRLRIIFESENGQAILRDNPVSFSQKHRIFGLRKLDYDYAEMTDYSTEQDPMSEL